MKILHTSDWHIGKKLMGRERCEEYKAVLFEISEICRTEEIDLCLVAGDVFDTYTPSAEAEEIFYNSVKQIANYSAVLIISGNHDDYVRLTAASKITEELNIYIIGNNLNAVKCEKRGKTYPVQSDCGYVIFENGKGERVYINTLPYPNEARFKEGKTEESFPEKISRWIQFGERGNTERLPSIFLSHLFAVGGSVSDSERQIDLGGARAVGLDLFPECDYAALGHLHKRQCLSKRNIYYSGAIMQFSFDETNIKKSVNIFELSGNGIENFKQIELKTYKKLIRLHAENAEDALNLLDRYKDSYVELTLDLKQPLNSNESSTLRRTENLISLKTNVDIDVNKTAIVSNKNKSSSQLFGEYYFSRYKAQPSDELMTFFLSLTEEE